MDYRSADVEIIGACPLESNQHMAIDRDEEMKLFHDMTNADKCNVKSSRVLLPGRQRIELFTFRPAAVSYK